MFSAQLDLSLADCETEVQVVIKRLMVPSQSEIGIQSDDINLIEDKGTHISEHDRLSAGGKWTTLCKGELGIGVADSCVTSAVEICKQEPDTMARKSLFVLSALSQKFICCLNCLLK